MIAFSSERLVLCDDICRGRSLVLTAEFPKNGYGERFKLDHEKSFAHATERVSRSGKTQN